MKVIKPQRKIPASDKEIFRVDSPVLCDEHIYVMKILSIEYGNALCSWLDNNSKEYEKSFMLTDLKIII